MTQKYRWLAALALLLTVGVCAARAEEEDSVKPPAPRPAAEALPPPKCVDEAGSCIRIVPPAGAPLYFEAPCPAPLFRAAFVPYSQPCAACPCPAGCPCCAACPSCCGAKTAAPMQYMVQLALCKATADGAREVVTCPQMCVQEDQAGTVEVGSDQSSIHMNVAVTKHGDGAMLNLGVEQAHMHNGGDADLHMRSEAAEIRCPVALGASTKLLLTENADGSPRTWVEVTVNEGKQDARSAGACPAAKPCGDEDSQMASLAQCVNDILCSVADTATELFGQDAWADALSSPSPQTLQQPPQYFLVEPARPMAREVGSQAPPSCSVGASYPRPSCPQGAAGCTQGAGAGCIQCSAGSCALCSDSKADDQQTTVHIGVDSLHHRVVMDTNEGGKHYTTSADRITVRDGCLLLEGNVHMESPGVDGSVVEATSDKISWKLPKGAAYQIGD